MRLTYFQILFSLLSLIFGVGCNSTNPESLVFDCGKGIIFSEALALSEKDGKYSYCLIESLQDSTLSDCDFSERINALSDHFHFQFCGIDCQDSTWINLSDSIRFQVREIITLGCLEYRSSCMFMSGIDYEKCSSVDLYEFCIEGLLSNKEKLISYRNALATICDECKK